MRLYVGCNFISTNNDNNSKPFFNQHLYNVLTKGKNNNNYMKADN